MHHTVPNEVPSTSPRCPAYLQGAQRISAGPNIVLISDTEQKQQSLSNFHFWKLSTEETEETEDKKMLSGN